MARAVRCTLLAGVVLLAACGSDGVSDVSDEPSTVTLVGPPPADTVGVGFRPNLVAAECVDGVPVSSRIRCGWLVVREDRDSERSATVRLPVAIVSGKGAAEQRDTPVVYLAGGPGESGLAGVAGFLDDGYAGDRDAILFDQRGTGSALPSLDCPEVADAVRATFASADPPLEEQKVLGAAFEGCHSRLVDAGIDLDAYRSETTAEDVEDLREALGYSQVDLYAASYGTTVALTVMRRHPASIRSATLDAVYPTTVTGDAVQIAENAERALAALDSECAAAPACAAQVPDVEATLASVVSRFDQQPVEALLDDPATGKTERVRITGADIAAGVVQAMYRASAIPAIPAALAQLASGDTSAVVATTMQGIAAVTRLSEGVAASVQCADRARLRSAATLGDLMRSTPRQSTLVMLGDMSAFCDAWGVSPATADFSTALRSDVPTLLFAGAFDPVTPPADAKAVARGLSQATLVELAGGGHGSVFSSPCAAEVFRSFLADPATEPDTSCNAVPLPLWPG